jgi:hypothetical protein
MQPLYLSLEFRLFCSEKLKKREKEFSEGLRVDYLKYPTWVQVSE